MTKWAVRQMIKGIYVTETGQGKGLAWDVGQVYNIGKTGDIYFTPIS